jgi:hypothetical protein
MYIAWAQRKGYDVDSLAEAGAPPVLLIRGPNVARILLGEDGIHKLHLEAASADQVPTHVSRKSASQIQLARVEVLSASKPAVTGEDQNGWHSDLQLTVLAEIPAADAKHAPRRLVEVSHPPDGLSVRIQAEEAEVLAAAFLTARLRRPPRGSAPSADEAIARIYYFARSQHARDPRTGYRDGRPREVLAGAIDAFLLAYHKSQDRPASASSPQSAAENAEKPRSRQRRPEALTKARASRAARGR